MPRDRGVQVPEVPLAEKRAEKIFKDTRTEKFLNATKSICIYVSKKVNKL